MYAFTGRTIAQREASDLGDCVAPRRIEQAIAEGRQAGENV
jgi:hypothetical protein